MEKSVLTILVGLPGSGKSTIAQRYKDIGYVVLSSDEYRKNVLGNEEDQSNNAKVFNKLYGDMKNYLAAGKFVVFDATNINIKARKRAIDIAKSLNCLVNAVVISVSIDECIYRDTYCRDRHVGADIIHKFVSRFEFPQEFEGFDSVKVVDTSTNSFSYDSSYKNTLLHFMMNFDQYCKYHAYNLLEHSTRLAVQMEGNKILEEAAMWHDLGKMYTQKFDKDGQAHYYQHANYSAYMLMSQNKCLLPDINDNDLFDIIFYVNQHMHIRDIIKSEKACMKYRKLFGNERFDNLIRFMEADNIASGRVYN